MISFQGMPKFAEEQNERVEDEEGNEGLTTALKRVDFPTLGRPTIPALRLMLILEDEEKRRRVP